MVGHVEHCGTGVQKDHVVLPHQSGGAAGNALLLSGVALLGSQVGLPRPELLLLQGRGSAVDLHQLPLAGQGVQVPADGGLRRPGGLAQVHDADGLVLGELLQNRPRALFSQHGLASILD